MFKKNFNTLFIFASLFFFSFTAGLYIGTVNNNFLGEKKEGFLNSFTFFSNFIDRLSLDFHELNISLDKKDYDSLSNEKIFFSKKNVLDKALTKWFDIKVSDQKSQIKKGKIRLKGLSIENHEKIYQNFSYKIKLNNNRVFGLSEFNLHFPLKRNMLSEWYGDKLLDFLDLINHKNYFSKITMNNKSLGLFLVEERFNKELLINNDREIGPIIRFSKSHLKNNSLIDLNESFKSSKIVSRFPNTHNDTASNLLESFLVKKIHYEEVFDVDKTASVIALAEICGYIHHLQFHNINFYYNPKLGRLEPIVNDFMFFHLKNFTDELYCLQEIKNIRESKKNWANIKHQWALEMYRDLNFLDLVIRKLKRFSGERFFYAFKKFISEEEDYAKLAITSFNPYFLPNNLEIMKKNMAQINYIIDVSEDPELVLNINKNVIKYKSYYYLPAFAIDVLCGDSVVYSFNDGEIIQPKHYGMRPKIKKIFLKDFPDLNSHNDLFLKYRLIGDEKFTTRPLLIEN